MKVLLRAAILSVRSPQLRFIIRGTKGTFVKYGLDVQEDQLKAMPNPAGIFAEGYGREPEDIWGTVETVDASGKFSQTQYAVFAPLHVSSFVPHLVSRWPTQEKGAYIDLFRNLADAIRQGVDLSVKWDEVITVLECIELAHRSSKEERTISLD